ncbi:Ankyrin repeat-containing protein [Chitinophaga sp. YR573]|uniref:ankyrin repeat domain-containing protein n=1 Tax=Chitinophaga sp. YR573 TaxID=1881040 RepID=UPI0008BEEC5C|nr:ankyrin repeat domain-containing protein [Chitinophaga sp. YR573]SEW46138.1 Ankyrin repeat-containing protein [Chitinophaga sp. YR573]
MSLFSKWFKKEEKEKKEVEENPLPWIEASENPWGVRLLDLRPISQKMLSTSSDPQMATNAVSYGSDDGTSFIGQEPVDKTTIETNITIPIDGYLAPGVLFIPNVMEHKWAIYFHGNNILFIRSWLRKVFVIAQTVQHNNQLIIERVQGKFTEVEEPVFTIAMLKFILISHAINKIVPAPLPADLISSTRAAGMWAFSCYGKMAHIGIFDETFEINATKPLRSHSLLHIAVARGDMKEAEKQLAAGISLNYLAGDGLAPLHWSISNDDGITEQLLLLGADPDVISTEGATPMMNAVQSNKMEQLLLLLKWKANVNARDYRGFTSLHRAAEMGHEDIVKVLLENGADKTIVAEGHTALSLAEMGENKNIIQLLQN